jgi:hypothetical protein
MPSHGLGYRLAELIESLPDRPFLLLLFIMGGAALFMPLGLFLKKLAQMTANWTIKLAGGVDEEEMAQLGAMVYGGAKEDGKIDGIPSGLTTGPVTHEGNTIGYEAVFKYTVANPLGMKLVVHRAGPLHRPLEFLPPEVPEVPESLKNAGYTLRCDPPELAVTAAQKAAALAPFAATGDLTELTLKDGELKARLYGTEDWGEDKLRVLLKAGAAAARGFN